MESVKKIIKAGFDVNTKLKNEKTALHVAVRNDHYKVVELLLNENADVNVRKDDDKTPLHLCRSKQIYKLLRHRGSDATLQFKGKNTLLHQAATHNRIEIATCFLEEYSNDVDILNEDDQTALHIAAKEGFEDMVKLLIDNKADINKEDKKSNTPLYYAVNKGYRKIVKILLEKKANYNLNDYKTKFFERDDWANGDVNCFHCLVEMGLDVNQKFEEEKTFLHHAVKNNYREVYTLFEANADADAKDKNGNMALHYACQGNPDMERSTDWIRTIGYLVNLTTDIDVRNDEGETPFQLVMKGNTEEVVDFTTRLLISKKASFTQADYDGNTPLHIAIQT